MLFGARTSSTSGLLKTAMRGANAECMRWDAALSLSGSCRDDDEAIELAMVTAISSLRVMGRSELIGDPCSQDPTCRRKLLLARDIFIPESHSKWHPKMISSTHKHQKRQVLPLFHHKYMCTAECVVRCRAS